MPVVLVGLNHKTAPVDVRERVAFGPTDLPSLLGQLKSRDGVGECAILSTCNRTEMYAATDDPSRCQQSLSRFLSIPTGLDAERYSQHLYLEEDEPAVSHLFSVSSGLDSMILGENQILGQVRKAYITAQEARVTGPILDRLFPWALRVGKRARSQTRIAQGASSVAAAAVELAQKIFGELAGHPLLLLGAGKMSEKALTMLVNAGVKQVRVVNRTFARANELAEQCGGEAVPFEDLDRALEGVDVMISSTGAPHYVVERKRLARVMRARRGRPLFLMDIAVPRDIEPSCEDLDNVYLYNIDDLQQAVDQTLARRHSEVQKVFEIVETETRQFVRYLDSRKASTAIVRLRSHFDHVRTRELDRFLQQHEVSPDEAQIFERFSQSLTKKLLHQPTQRLRQLGVGGADPEELVRSLEILGLSEEEEAE